MLKYFAQMFYLVSVQISLRKTNSQILTLQPYLNKRLKIHDTCGVHNLHGMPAVLAALAGAIASALATEKTYGSE